MKPHLVLATSSLVAILSLAGCNDGGGGDEGGLAFDPANFQAVVDNPLFPLTPGGEWVYEGEERDPDTGEVIEIRVEARVLPHTATVADVEVTVVEVKDYEDGELVESTLDYYAQHADGTVYYFGERVDDYEGGEVVGHGGQWLSGEGDNQPGIFMPTAPQVGDEFQQERAPGIAEDESKVISTGEALATPAGDFADCVRTEDFDPLGGATEFKYYCPNVGLVREESDTSELNLISY